jgi:hypothetical protein
VFEIKVSELDEGSEISDGEVDKGYRQNPKFIKNISVKLEKYTQLKMNEKLNAMRHSKGSMKLAKPDSPGLLQCTRKSQFADDDLDDMKSILGSIYRGSSDPKSSDKIGVKKELHQRMQNDVKNTSIDGSSVISSIPFKKSQDPPGVYSGGDLDKHVLDLRPLDRKIFLEEAFDFLENIKPWLRICPPPAVFQESLYFNVKFAKFLLDWQSREILSQILVWKNRQ